MPQERIQTYLPIFSRKYRGSSVTHFFARLSHLWSKSIVARSCTPRQRRPGQASFLPRLEALEDRTVLAANVTSTYNPVTKILTLKGVDVFTPQAAVQAGDNNNNLTITRTGPN